MKLDSLLDQDTLAHDRLRYLQYAFLSLPSIFCLCLYSAHVAQKATIRSPDQRVALKWLMRPWFPLLLWWVVRAPWQCHPWTGLLSQMNEKGLALGRVICTSWVWSRLRTATQQSRKPSWMKEPLVNIACMSSGGNCSVNGVWSVMYNCKAQDKIIFATDYNVHIF